MQNLIERIRAVVESQTESHRRFKELEERTGLKATSWQNFLNGRQRPTWEMIELVSKTWPQFAFWIATGIHDEEHGHQKVDPYRPVQNRLATEYFQMKIKATGIGEIFSQAMKRATLTIETSGDMAGHARYEFAPEDKTVFGDWTRVSEIERKLFIAREEQDAPIVTNAIERYRGLEPISDPDNTKMYAPKTN
jgi:transcriptional regulator with XRE-family HTH domain